MQAFACMARKSCWYGCSTAGVPSTVLTRGIAGDGGYRDQQYSTPFVFQMSREGRHLHPNDSCVYLLAVWTYRSLPRRHSGCKDFLHDSATCKELALFELIMDPVDVAASVMHKLRKTCLLCATGSLEFFRVSCPSETTSTFHFHSDICSSGQRRGVVCIWYQPSFSIDATLLVATVELGGFRMTNVRSRLVATRAGTECQDGLGTFTLLIIAFPNLRLLDVDHCERTTSSASSKQKASTTGLTRDNYGDSLAHKPYPFFCGLRPATIHRRG
eukprot:6188093-Pleurochrysis_carterae.AAC.1